MQSKVLIFVALLLAVVSPALAQDEMMTPSVTVVDQNVTDGTVTIESAVSPSFGFLVIHADGGEGPGPVIGFRSISPGMNANFTVAIDDAGATPRLFAMLHEDTGEIGTYEFGTVEGADGPVVVDGAPVTPAFNVDVVAMHDQFVSDGTVTARSVVTDEAGWLVIHADGGEGPGPVLGFTLVNPGQNNDVVVELDGEATATLYPMLHVDTGEAGTYEFGTVEGADGPVVDADGALTFPISTVPAMRIPDQIAFGSDSMGDMGQELVADTVLSEGPGWLVVHADGGEGPGPVIGFAAVADGLNEDVLVPLDAEGVTPVLYPMLHVDTGTVGEYEFGTVEGADGPVVVDGAPLVFPINGAPSITYAGTLGDVLHVEHAVIDAPGWLAIHADNGEGGPGPVIGVAPLLQGANHHIAVELDAEGITETLFPMLHYDTNEAGVYEFGTVEGADGPVIVQGAPVVGPLMPEAMDMMDG